MTNKTIALIGATEKMGSQMARRLAGQDNSLLLFSHEPVLLAQLISEIKNEHPNAIVESAGCEFEASWEADIIIAAVPLQDVHEVAEKIREVATQKIVAAVSDESVSELKKLLPYSQVIHASKIEELIEQHF
jgi:predicted dinucleotide-binding enzyme